MNAMHWTEPYHGVQHLRTAPPSYQITVEDYGTFATVTRLHLRGNHPFNAEREETAPSAVEAREVGERWARALAEAER